MKYVKQLEWLGYGRVLNIFLYEKIKPYILKGGNNMGNAFLYLGEMDCIGDLIDRVGEDAAYKAWCGRLCYFKNITDGQVFGVSDYEADYIFEEYGVY